MPDYTYTTSVKLQHTDSAGLLFFANQLVFAHEAYESFMEELGVSFRSMLKRESFLIPIVHAEVDFHKPLSVGDRVKVHLRVASIGTSSFVLEYLVENGAGLKVGSCKTVHVTISKSEKKKIALPCELREALAEYVKP